MELPISPISVHLSRLLQLGSAALGDMPIDKPTHFYCAVSLGIPASLAQSFSTRNAPPIFPLTANGFEHHSFIFTSILVLVTFLVLAFSLVAFFLSRKVA